MSKTNYFFYDNAGRLLSTVYADNFSVTNNLWRDTFVYDGLGRLREQLHYTPDTGVSPLLLGGDPNWAFQDGVLYVYDGWRLIQERDQNTPMVSYTRGNDLSGSIEGAGGIGGLLARSTGYTYPAGNWPTHSYYFADGNGNITYMLNASQSMVARYRYDPFGNTISSSGTLVNDNVYRFSSKEIHVNTGMYYYGYRFYDPNLQRWITDDPTLEDANPQTLTSTEGYTFLGNEPTAHWDALGRATAGGGVPTNTSWKEHQSFLTFTVSCPKDEQVSYDGVDHSGAVPALRNLFGKGAVDSETGPTPPAEGLGHLDSLFDPNPSGVNCDGKPVQIIIWMRSRFASPAPWFAGSKATAGAVAYAAGSVIKYHCEPCVCKYRRSLTR